MAGAPLPGARGTRAGPARVFAPRLQAAMQPGRSGNGESWNHGGWYARAAAAALGAPEAVRIGGLGPFQGLGYLRIVQRAEP
jgi:hypothetical protein